MSYDVTLDKDELWRYLRSGWVMTLLKIRMSYDVT